MAPGFVNLRFMCHCLARALKLHLEFNPTNANFLIDLQQEADNEDLEFSYNLEEHLKVTLNPNMLSKLLSQGSPYLKENKISLLTQTQKETEIDKQVIDIQCKLELLKLDQPSFEQRIVKFGNFHKEPEPELIEDSKHDSALDDDFDRKSVEDLEDDFEDVTGINAKQEFKMIEKMREDSEATQVFKRDQSRLNDFMSRKKLTRLE